MRVKLANLLRHLGALITRRHLEGEVEGRKILARMIVSVSQLRDAEIVRPGLNAFVDSGVEIDEVHARRAGRFHENLDIALAVEGTDVARVVVVVDHVIDIGGILTSSAPDGDSERNTRPGGTPRDPERR